MDGCPCERRSDEMIIKGLVDEDFVNYKMPCMYICTSTCSFKCDRELGGKYCQNSSLARQPDIAVDNERIVQRYLQNPITHALCLSGLEPFDQFEDIVAMLNTLRRKYSCDDMVVIYSGYTKEELRDKIAKLQQYGNIIIKFGRYRPSQEKHFDNELGVYLASNNQYAERIC